MNKKITGSRHLNNLGIQIHTHPYNNRIYDELLELKQLEELNPIDNEESEKKFLAHFDWTDDTLSPILKLHIEDILVQYHDIFASHRFDIDYRFQQRI